MTPMQQGGNEMFLCAQEQEMGLRGLQLSILY